MKRKRDMGSTIDPGQAPAAAPAQPNSVLRLGGAIGNRNIGVLARQVADQDVVPADSSDRIQSSRNWTGKLTLPGRGPIDVLVDTTGPPSATVDPGGKPKWSADHWNLTASGELFDELRKRAQDKPLDSVKLTMTDGRASYDMVLKVVTITGVSLVDNEAAGGASRVVRFTVSFQDMDVTRS